MALHAIHEDGTLHWKCSGLGMRCQNPITVHLSHEDVQWHEDGAHVVLPHCPSCGAQTTLKVAFTDDELAAPNMVEYGMVPQPMTLPHAVTGEPIEVMIPALMPVGRNPFVDRHQKLAELLKAHGKHPPKKESDTAHEPTATK